VHAKEVHRYFQTLTLFKTHTHATTTTHVHTYIHTPIPTLQVDPDKNIVHLTDTDPRKANQDTSSNESTCFTPEEKQQALVDIIGSDQAEQVMELEKAVMEGGEGAKASVVLRPESDKQKRTAIHQ
jgi:hypothetical protein